MQRYIDAGLVPGTVTLVARKGKIVHLEARGARDAESGAPMSTDVIFRIASMTKPITSVALMMLYEEGKFRLNDPDQQVDAGVRRAQGRRAAARLGGRPALSAGAGGASDHRAPAAHPHRRVRQLLPRLLQGGGGQGRRRSRSRTTPSPTTSRASPPLPLNYQPGERWEYSGATNHVGRLVEILSGMTLDEFFRSASSSRWA